MKTKKEKLNQLQRLLSLPKFNATENGLYTGVQDSYKKQLLTNALDRSIQEFMDIVKLSDDPVQYQKAISNAIKYIDNTGEFIDTEDKEQFCTYIEHMMDAVGLESSGGILNNWLYGFNPQ